MNSDFFKKSEIPELAPYLHGRTTVGNVMRDVLIALFPIAAYSVFKYGFKVLISIVIAVITSLVSEWIWQKAFKLRVRIEDLSSAVTAVVLVLILPPDISWPAVIIGTVFAIVPGKQAFGGTGRNLLNPAVIGWLFLQFVFPNETGNVVRSFINSFMQPAVFNLNNMLENILKINNPINEQFNSISGVLPVLIGIGYLIVRKRILFSVSISFGMVLIAAYALAGLHFWKICYSYLFCPVALFSIFILASDPVTSPISKAGKLIFGAGAGILSIFFFSITGIIFSLFISLLLMNLLVPYIDLLTIPRPEMLGKYLPDFK